MKQGKRENTKSHRPLGGRGVLIQGQSERPPYGAVCLWGMPLRKGGKIQLSYGRQREWTQKNSKERILPNWCFSVG